ncbi:MAG TPA: ligase-associated DNA damage response endonuclease PdeM [Burkholderiaceae bacterium]|nr:ligase-associated DNA damage response endonuclease PdeM [Burkholderiaceae bacterium]
MLEIEVAGQRLVLLADKAAFLPGERCLLVADAHLGKAVSFRRLGVPVPRGTTTAGLTRLSGLLEHTGATRLVFLGDFLHSERAHAPATLQALAHWRERHRAVELALVRGNHDARAGDPPGVLGIECVDGPLCLGTLALCHEPQEMPGAYVLAGHLHPCIHVAGRGWERLRLPCFWVGRRCGVLPAFGEFTGMAPVQPAPGDRLYAIADDRVIALPQ